MRMTKDAQAFPSRTLTSMAAHFPALRSAAPALLVWGALTVGCGSIEEPLEPSRLAHQSQELGSDNGLSANGLSANGLSANGLSANGLSANGLKSEDFRTWFQSNRPLSVAVMRYVVLCAVPAGESRTFRDDSTGETFTWSGALGLAPDWARGRRASTTEQQLVSACLAAHVNKYGVHIPISVLGKTSKNQVIPYTSSELATFSHKEACFFGNLFTSESINVGKEGGNLNPRESSARACSLWSNTYSTRSADCAPLTYVGSCGSYCSLDGSKTYYTSCNFNGTKYRPITTRLREEDIYYCGDGVCQISESCGDGTQYNNCLLDCGPCQ